MKRLGMVPLLVSLTLCAACSGGSNGPSSPPPNQRFSVGGTIAGLTATGLVLANGTDSLSPSSTASSFTFPTTLADGSSYSVAISLEPSGEHCSLGNATGTVSNAAVTNITVTCASRLWTWLGGSQAAGQVGVTGNEGMPDAQNMPGARTGSVSWTDKAGNLWIFGGEAPFQAGGYPNDLWKYSPIGKTWTWVTGVDPTIFSSNPIGVYGTRGVPSTTTTPGGRHWAASWIDTNDTLWLFGGIGYDANGNWGLLNDLWKFTSGTGQWTWVSGSDTNGSTSIVGVQGVADAANTPGDRDNVASWTDAQSNLWLYGGFGDDPTAQRRNALGDLWKFDTSTSMWTWVGGVTSVNAPTIYPPLGTGTANATPGGRIGSVTWTDKSGNFWLFGGEANLDANTGGQQNDLWKYSPASGTWSWMQGSQTSYATPSFGALGIADATHGPGALSGALTWTDASGQLWLFGGNWYDVSVFPWELHYANQLWEFRPATGHWTWVSGSPDPDVGGSYGTLGTGAPSNVPGSRYLPVGGIDGQGNFLLLGGGGYGGPNEFGVLNDLWKF